jgi:hypothetical protein
VVARGALDERVEPEIRNPRAAVPRDRLHDPSVAPRQQEIGDHRRDVRALRDREKMRGSHARRDGREVGIGKSGRAAQHWSGNPDVVVSRQTPDHTSRCALDRRDALRDSLQRIAFDLFDQALEHVVEQRDLLGVEPTGVIDEEIGHPLRHLGAPAGRAVSDRLFKLRDQDGWRHAGLDDSG